jgi:nucleoid DNA-binding protein
MDELSKLLVDLLLKHNRVSLPGIGAFLANSQPANINEHSNMIAPPFKAITFSKEETWNDGLLEALYAQRYGLSGAEANNKVKLLMMDIRFELDDKGKVIFNGLGYLRQGEETRDISFGQNKKINLNADSFGLPEFSLPLKGKKRPQSTPVKIAKKPTLFFGKSRNPYNIALVVSACIVSVMVATGLYLYLSHSSSNNEKELASKTNPTIAELPTDDNDEYAEQDTEEGDESEVTMEQNDDVERHIEKNTTRSTVPAAAPPKSAPKIDPPVRDVTSARTQYCIIVANVGGSRSLAEEKVRTFIKMGYKDSRIAGENNGRYRIAAACYTNQEQARRELTQIKRVIPDAWLLEKK